MKNINLTYKIRYLVSILILSLLQIMGSAAHAVTYMVTSSSGSGPGTLEQAILNANANPGADRIEFNIFPNIFGVTHTIMAPASGFPMITDPVVIDGYSEPGAAQAITSKPASLKIILDGSNVTVSDGLFLDTDNSEIHGLVIRDFNLHGLTIFGDNNIVRGCHIGTNTYGSAAAANSQSGIRIDGNNNEIGGLNHEDRNVLSGNGSYGIDINGEENRIYGNYIGTSSTGLDALGNGLGGIKVYGTENQIGDDIDGAGNLISGNEIYSGVLISSGASNNLIQGNLIGLDVTGTTDIYNHMGITIFGDYNIIGGTTEEARNVISGNVFEGIDVFANGNIIQGNYIGTDVYGTTAVPNYAGVRLQGDFNLVGGLRAEAGNVISGNLAEGISLWRNTYIDDLPNGNSIQSNAIGTDPGHTQRLGNDGPGIQIAGGILNVIGWTLAQGANTIVANGSHGILIGSEFVVDTTNGNLALVNHIGANEAGAQLGNQGSGVYILNGDHNWIGSLGRGNTIAYNDADGITLVEGVSNTFLGNSIYRNQNSGIDLNDDGRTLNDVNDVDTGPNNLQNYVTNLTARLVSGQLEIEADLNSTPNTEFRVEVFSNPGCFLSTGIGMARNYLGYQLVRTDLNGDATVSTTLPAKTLTIANGIRTTVSENVNSEIPKNTSEFSDCVRVTL